MPQGNDCVPLATLATLRRQRRKEYPPSWSSSYPSGNRRFSENHRAERRALTIEGGPEEPRFQVRYPERAEGLAAALLSTAAGLLIAVLAYLAHHFLHGRVRALVHEMEFAGHDITQFLQHEMTRQEQQEVEEHAK